MCALVYMYECVHMSRYIWVHEWICIHMWVHMRVWGSFGCMCRCMYVNASVSAYVYVYVWALWQQRSELGTLIMMSNSLTSEQRHAQSLLSASGFCPWVSWLAVFSRWHILPSFHKEKSTSVPSPLLSITNTCQYPHPSFSSSWHTSFLLTTYAG